jgi:hypothetical protein
MRSAALLAIRRASLNSSLFSCRYGSSFSSLDCFDHIIGYDPGFGSNSAVEMNAPYSAYVIDDYTGIIPPFGF